jgi:hypothetical protein
MTLLYVCRTPAQLASYKYVVKKEFHQEQGKNLVYGYLVMIVFFLVLDVPVYEFLN